MIARRRHLQLLDVERSYGGVRSPALRAYAVRLRGAEFDTRSLGPGVAPALLEPSPTGGQVTFVLRGALLTRHATEHVTEEGGVLAKKRAPWDERWSDGLECIVVEWQSDASQPTARLERGPIETPLRARLTLIHRELLSGRSTNGAALTLVRDLTDAIRSMGIAVPAWTEIASDPPPADTQRIADAISDATSTSVGRAMLTDVCVRLGWSERYVRRRTRALAEWLDVPEGSLRRRFLHDRALAAVTLLDAKGRRVEDVARATGYGSSRALALALRQLGSGTPSEIQARSRTLRCI